MLQLLPLNERNLADACSLYELSFPQAERRPTQEWIDLMRMGKVFRIYEISRGGTFVGFITLWHFTAFIYVEHFAISPSERGGGIGAGTMRALIKESKNIPILLEVEPAITEIAKRRIAFYERQGLCLLPYTYKQPPYRPTEPYLDLRLMSTRREWNASDIKSAIHEIYRSVYGVNDGI